MPKGDREILKADPEDGTTPISNLLLEALALAPLSGQEKGLVLYLWRQTYGWTNGKARYKEAKVSLDDWAGGVQSNKTYISRIIKSLVDKRVILREDMGQGKGYIYSTNTRINEWLKGSLTLVLSKRITPIQKDNGYLDTQGLHKNGTQGLSKNGTQGLSKRITPTVAKSGMLKEILKKDKEIDTLIDIGNITSISGQSIGKAIEIARGEHPDTPKRIQKFYQGQLDLHKIEWRTVNSGQ